MKELGLFLLRRPHRIRPWRPRFIPQFTHAISVLRSSSNATTVLETCIPSNDHVFNLLLPKKNYSLSPSYPARPAELLTPPSSPHSFMHLQDFRGFSRLYSSGVSHVHLRQGRQVCHGSISSRLPGIIIVAAVVRRRLIASQDHRWVQVFIRRC